MAEKHDSHAEKLLKLIFYEHGRNVVVYAWRRKMKYDLIPFTPTALALVSEYLERYEQEILKGE